MDEPIVVKTGEFQGNSHKERQKQEKIITGKAKKREKPLSKRIFENFVSDDVPSVGTYIVFDVMIPAAKNMLMDMVSEGVERMLFGDSRRSRTSSIRPQAGYTSYSSYYGRAQPPKAREVTRRDRATHNFDDIVLDNRGEAENIIDRLSDLIENYDTATVADLYDLAGITSNFTDDRWGWYTLEGASVSHLREGYLLNLPKPVPID